ncbi:MAG TPA: acVLRF1 family peptidyl-tRNA hydrolase [Solirubrobacteraceae bacterium]|nr:acVLRF1 family peptidyl-tRNA hydrolase [Solirubrobacteraceae bacterium]
MPDVDQYSIPPERLQRWIDRWAARHGGVQRTAIEPAAVALAGADGATLRAEPPFPPLDAASGTREGLHLDELLAHVERPRTVGVLLVRLGGHAAGIFEGRELRASKVSSRLVHGRHRAGGSSANRFRRRRENQARAALQAAAATAERILAEPARTGRLDAVVLGGDRRALAEVLEDARLRPVAALAVERIIEVPEPRRAVLESTPDLFLATHLLTHEP